MYFDCKRISGVTAQLVTVEESLYFILRLQRAEPHHAGGDVEMPSAKMEAKKEEKAAGELDAKARIKAAILNAGLRRKQIGR